MSQSIMSATVTVPSLSFLKIQASLVTGAPINYEEKSTINEHLSILKDKKPLPTEFPLLNYMVVGQRGHVGELDDDNMLWALPVSHEPTDAAPYRIVPLVIRENDNDLTKAQRANYALRRSVTYNGVRYWAYYAKRLPSQTERAILKKITKSGDDEQIETFVYTDSNLYPEPPTLSTNALDEENRLNSTNTDGQYVAATVPKFIEFDTFDTAEFINVAAVTKNNPLKAVISELVLCTGVDVKTTVDAGDGSNFEFTEVIGLQPGIYVSCYHNLAMSNARLAYNIGVGQTKPMKLRSK